MPPGKSDQIKWVKHDDIDFHRWDNLVDLSANGHVYACSWYLDTVAWNWDALVFGDYEHVMPVPYKKKWGIRYVYQPFFTQQLGIYPSPPGNIQHVFARKLSESCRYFDYQSDQSLLPGEFTGYLFTSRRNRSLALNVNYEILVKGFSENTLRNIRKAAQKMVEVRQHHDAGDFVLLKKRYVGLDVPEDSFRILKKLMSFSIGKGIGRIYTANTPDGEIMSAAFFLFHKTRVYYLNAFSTEAGMANGSAFAIVNKFCYEFAGSELILDFEGSEIEGIDRFYRGFGAKEDFYYHLHFNRIPFFILQLKKKLRL